MSRYNDATRGSREPESNGHRCHAHGCPLSGAISESTRGGGPFFCRFHFGTDPKEWQAITETVRATLRDRESGDYLPAYANVGAPMDTEPA